jgi:hypothetical protein
MTAPLKSMTVARRRPEVSHDQLVAAWRSPHAPGVVEHMKPDHYAITFFDPRDGRAPFDGMAALTYHDPGRAGTVTGRNTPEVVANDGWVDLVQLPMERLTVTENVIVAGPGSDPSIPARADERNEAFKMTFLVSARPGVDPEAIQRHWLERHAPNVASAFVAAGGLRYVVNLVDLSRGNQAYVGVAELSYQDLAAAKAHHIADDGFNALTTGIALPGRELVMVA